MIYAFVTSSYWFMHIFCTVIYYVSFSCMWCVHVEEYVAPEQQYFHPHRQTFEQTFEKPAKVFEQPIPQDPGKCPWPYCLFKDIVFTYMHACVELESHVRVY